MWEEHLFLFCNWGFNEVLYRGMPNESKKNADERINVAPLKKKEKVVCAPMI
jgi:hypothetical protein